MSMRNSDNVETCINNSAATCCDVFFYSAKTTSVCIINKGFREDFHMFVHVYRQGYHPYESHAFRCFWHTQKRPTFNTWLIHDRLVHCEDGSC